MLMLHPVAKTALTQQPVEYLFDGLIEYRLFRLIHSDSPFFSIHFLT